MKRLLLNEKEALQTAVDERYFKLAVGWRSGMRAKAMSVACPFGVEYLAGHGNLLSTGKAQNYNWKFMKRM